MAIRRYSDHTAVLEPVDTMEQKAAAIQAAIPRLLNRIPKNLEIDWDCVEFEVNERWPTAAIHEDLPPIPRWVMTVGIKCWAEEKEE